MIDRFASLDDLLTESLSTPLRVDVTVGVMAGVRRQRWMERLIPWVSALLALGIALSVWQFWLSAQEQSLWELLRSYAQEFTWQAEFLADTAESVSAVFPAGAFTMVALQLAVGAVLWRWQRRLGDLTSLGNGPALA